MVRPAVSASSVPGRSAIAMRMSAMDVTEMPSAAAHSVFACARYVLSCDSVAIGEVIVDVFVEFTTLPATANAGSLVRTRTLSKDDAPPLVKRPSEPSTIGALYAHVVTYAPFRVTATDVPLSESDSV